MKIKNRADILSEIIKESKKHPTGWKAAIGRDYNTHSQDYYIFNPDVGCYLLKEYQKNPYHRTGIGSKIARNIDDEIQHIISDKEGDFGILQGDMRRVLINLKQGYTPHHIINEAISGNDLGITLHARGKAASSENKFKTLREIFLEKQKKLDQKISKILTQEGVYTSYD